MTTSEERIQAIREETERIYQRIAKSREESDARIAKLEEEARAQSQETERLLKELSVIVKEQTRQIKEQGRQLGDYGNKFGSYTESLAHPSIGRILKERFGARYESGYWRRTKRHGEVEIDGWGVARNGISAAYLIEIKSRFRLEHIEQLWRHVEMFRKHEPEYANAAVYPVLAVVEIEEGHRREIWEAGIYLIEVAEGVFELSQPPAEFEPCGDHGAGGADGGLQRAVPHHLHLVPKAGPMTRKG